MTFSKILKHPALWNALASSGIFMAADLSQQTIMKNPKYELDSVKRMGIIGFTFGPMSYVWHTRLERLLPGVKPMVVMKKVILTTSITGAVLNFLFYTMHSALEGKEDLFEEVIDKWPRTYMTGWLFWPAMNTLNIVFSPVHLRGINANLIGYVWGVILSFFKKSDFKVPQNISETSLPTPAVVSCQKAE